MEAKGLIFDCDGTLADTMPLHWIAWSTVAKRHGFHFPEERFYALAGQPARQILSRLSEEQDITLNIPQITSQKVEIYLPLLDQVQPIHSVVEIAREHHNKIPMAVATGSVHSVVEPLLKQLGIRELFDAVVTSEDVERQKPFPDIFLEASNRIGVAPTHCRAYEDADLGIQAIEAAGMQAVDVRNF
jgi:beta-phosphoglucomutase family hydrolase